MLSAPDFDVLELVLIGAAIEDEAGAMVGRLESIASVVYWADKPVTFVQMLGGGTEPATKLTVEHCKERKEDISRSLSQSSSPYLEQDPVRSILHHLNHTL